MASLILSVSPEKVERLYFYIKSIFSENYTLFMTIYGKLDWIAGLICVIANKEFHLLDRRIYSYLYNSEKKYLSGKIKQKGKRKKKQIVL